MRTHYKRFLDYIKSVASLFQYQREKIDDVIVATGEDYNIAREVLLKTTSNPSMIPLTRQKKDILDLFEKHENKWFAIRDIEDKFPLSDRYLRKLVKELFREEFLLSNSEFREGVKKPVPIYCYSQINKIEIPNFSSVNTFNTFNTFNTVNTVNSVNHQQEKKGKKEGENHDNVSQEQRNKRNKRNWNLTEKDSLHNEILELKKYCEKVQSKGKKITHENLVFHFGKAFVEICKNRKVLIKLPDGSYDLGG